MEWFLFRIVLLEVLYAVLRAPMPDVLWPRGDKPQALPSVLVIEGSLRSGWYWAGDCLPVNASLAYGRVETATEGVCLEGPFRQLYQLEARVFSLSGLKYAYRTLYIN